MNYIKYTRRDKDGDTGVRILEINNCFNDCPYANDKESSASCSFSFRCGLTNIDYRFDDNLIHFSTPKDCPLEKKQSI